MKNEDLLKESIHLILNYHGRSLIVEFKKYKTLVHVKQKVFDLFYPVKNNINIYLNNKNLEPLVNQPIGYIFSGQSLVNLKVVDEGVINTPYKLINRYQDSFYTTNDLMSMSKRNFNFINKASKTNTSSITNKLSKSNSEKKNKGKDKKNIMLNQNNLFSLKKELTKNYNITSNRNINNNKKLVKSGSMDNFNNKKYQIGKAKLPPIIQNNNKKNNKNNNNNIIYNKCNDCYINKISIYCRLCDKFLCNNCALNKKSYHIKHKDDFITLIQDSNNANIKQYKKIINNILKDALSSFDNIGKNKNKGDNEQEENENENKEVDNENDEKSNKEEFDYNEMITKISGNVYKLVDHATEMKSNLKDIDFSHIDDSNDRKINEICENEKKVLKKLDVYEYVSPFQPFFILNTYERNMAKYFNNYGVNCDERLYIKTKIELMFENVEKEVDDTLSEIENIIGNKELFE